jgi:exosome complex RNA-binding protein Rrp42 (RNase PH superfamily)
MNNPINIPIQVFRPKEYYLSLYSNDVRKDGRKLSEIRPLTVQKMPVHHKEQIDLSVNPSWIMSSVQVKLGNTIVLAVVNGSIRSPKSEGQNTGEFGEYL